MLFKDMNEIDEAPSFKVGWAWQFLKAELDQLIVRQEGNK
jgi:hypothetical protein